MNIIVPDFKSLGSCGMDRLERELRQELHPELNLKKTEYAMRQNAVQKRTRDDGPLKTVDGIGQLVGEVDMHTAMMWEIQEGHGIWTDPAFIKKMLKDNPELRAPRPVMKPRVMVG